MKTETYTRLHAMIRDRLPMENNLDEIVSDTLVKLIDSAREVLDDLDSDNEDDQLAAMKYAGKVAANAAMDRHRHRQRQPGPLATNMQADRRTPTPLEILIHDEEAVRTMTDDKDPPAWMLDRLIGMPDLHWELAHLMAVHGNVPDCAIALRGRYGLSDDLEKCKSQLWNAKRSISKRFEDQKPE